MSRFSLRTGRKKGFTMRSIIKGLCIGCTIFALALLAVLFEISSCRIIGDKSQKDSADTLGRMLDETNSHIHRLSSEMLTIYSETDFVSGMRNMSQNSRSMKKYYWISSDLAKNRFSRDDELLNYYIYGIDDTLISSYRSDVSHYPHDIFNSSFDMNIDRIRDYIASDNTDLFITGYHNPMLNKDIIRLVIKLHDYDETRKQYGFIVCDFDSTSFTDIMDKYFASSDVCLWIQPKGDIPIATTGDRTENENDIYKNISEQAKNNSGNESFIREIDSFYLTEVESEKYGFYSFILTPKSLTLENQKSLISAFILISVAMVVVISVLSSFLSRYLSEPVEKMKDIINRIKNGETSLRVEPIGWSEELELLGSEFNEMLDRIQNMMKEEYESRMLVERTEYNMLQAQINPHFLYNTLDTMSGIANSQGCVQVSGLCQSLSAIFRYCMDMSDNLSTMQKETAHVRNYIYVMNVRNGNSVECDFDIDPDTLQDQMPRLTIQPIIENALTHGLRTARHDDKRCGLSAAHVDGVLEIHVTDNGVGMNADEMNKALEKNDPDVIKIGKSIGILNVNARLKSIFGKEYGLHVVSEIDKGTDVIIRIPVKKGDDSVG